MAVDYTVSQREVVQNVTLLSLQDLATLTQKSYRTILKWQAEGKLPPRAAVPGHPRYRMEDVEAWLKG